MVTRQADRLQVVTSKAIILAELVLELRLAATRVGVRVAESGVLTGCEGCADVLLAMHLGWSASSSVEERLIQQPSNGISLGSALVWCQRKSNMKYPRFDEFVEDPMAAVGHLISLHGVPAASSKRVLLDEAHSQTERAARYRELRDQERSSSAGIGAAKRQGEPIDALLTKMRATSDQRKELESDLRAYLASLQSLWVDNEEPPATSLEGKPGYLEYRFTDNVRQCSVHVRAEQEPADWNTYVLAHSASTSWHLSEVLDAMQEACGVPVTRLVARDDNKRCLGVLPVVELNSRIFGRRMVSLPWVNYGSDLSDNQSVQEDLLDTASSRARDSGAQHLELRETNPREGWPSRQHKVTLTRALPGSVDTLERSFGSAVRAQSRKAERSGCDFVVGGLELLKDFHTVLSVNMRDLGSPAHGLRFYERLVKALGERLNVAVVYKGGTPLAAGILVSHGNTVEIPWASALGSAKSMDVNMYMYRKILGHTVEQGFQYFDFGRSSPNSPTHKFKLQWGARAHPLYWHYWLGRNQTIPDLRPENSKYSIVVAAWKRAPVSVTKVIGAQLVTGIP